MAGKLIDIAKELIKRVSSQFMIFKKAYGLNDLLSHESFLLFPVLVKLNIFMGIGRTDKIPQKLLKGLGRKSYSFSLGMLSLSIFYFQVM